LNTQILGDDSSRAEHITGIVVGGIVAVSVILIIIYCFVAYRKRSGM